MRTVRSRLLWLLGLVIPAVMLLVVACEDKEEAEQATPWVTPEATESAENVPGVTDTEILLGTHFALSGSPAAAYAPITDGMRAYFEYINDRGGVYGRKITFVIADDHYNPADTVEVVRRLVEHDKVFAIVGGLGEVTHGAVWKYLEEEGVPDLFITSGLHKWSEPAVRTRFSGSVDFVTEGRMLGAYVAKNYDGTRLGLLLQDDELGTDGETGLRMALEGSDVEVVARETYEAVNFDVTAQTQRLKNADVDVIVAFALPPQGASLTKTAREVLNWDVPILVSGIDVSDIFIDLAGPENAEGVVSVVFGHQIYETDHPGIQRHYEIMEEYGHGVPVSNFTLYGQGIAELTVHVLEKAGRNLTRDTLIEAAESVRGFQCSVCLVPMSMSPTDHRPIEIEMYNRVQGGKWVAFGEPISFESTPAEEAE